MEKEEKTIKPQKSGWFKLATTLNVFAILCFVFGAVSVAIPILYLLYYLVLVLIGILSLFTLFFNEDYQKLLDGGEIIGEVGVVLLQVAPYVSGTAVAFGIASLLIYSLKKDKTGHKKVGGIVLSSVFLALNLVLFAIHAFGGISFT